jgi:alanyl-tRNA synthetase
MELCGGTHVARTGDIGVVKIVSEGASAAGIRRIEALAGETARRYLAAQDRRLKSVASLLRIAEPDVEERIEALIEERRKLERDLAEARRKLAMGGGGAGQGAGVSEVGGVKLMTRALEGIEAKDLKSIADDGKRRVGSGVVALANASPDGKLSLVVGVTDDLTQKFNAIDLVRIGARAAGGKGGGGRPDMAQAGGPDGARAEDALKAIGMAVAGG